MRFALFLSATGVHSRERMLLAVAERLVQNGHRVDIVTACPSTDWKKAVPLGAQLVDLERWWPWRSPRGLSNKARIYLSAPALARYLRRMCPHVLLAGSIPPNLTALLAQRLADSETTLVLRQSNVVRIPGSPRFGDVRRRPRDPLIARWYPRAAAVIAVSQGVADNVRKLTGLAPEKIHTVPNWSVLPDVSGWAAARLGHPWLVPERSWSALLAVGRLVPKKDYPTLLRALARVREARDARLIVLGKEGSEAPRIRALIRELGLWHAVDLVGHRTNPYAFYARADCYILASISEGMPSALVEALACGCPVVSTDCPSGPAEILEGGRYGALVPVGDYSALARTILATLVEPPDREGIRARGEALSQEQAVGSYVELLEQAGRARAMGPAEPPEAGVTGS